jgi:hypothetical protein
MYLSFIHGKINKQQCEIMELGDEVSGLIFYGARMQPENESNTASIFHHLKGYAPGGGVEMDCV